MSNSFNISVKPEIAALEAKVDIIDTEVDTIRATDLPGIDTKVDTIDTVVDAVRATDVPNIQTDIAANETKIDAIDTVVDAVKLKTDLLPQNVRGAFYSRFIQTTSGTYVDIVNLTGHGILLKITLNVLNLNDTASVLVTIDGNALPEITHTGDVLHMNAYPEQGNVPNNSCLWTLEDCTGANANLINLEFNTSLLVQIKRSAGANNEVHSAVMCIIDAF